MKKLNFIMTFAVAMIVTIVFSNAMTCEAAFDAPYYNITTTGCTFDKEHYYLPDGTMVKNSFFCDGTYTYYLQADGTPMKERLTYHPDGTHVIYFDAYGHEVFSDFAHISKSISGNDVDDMCFFDVNGYMYVDTLTYDKTGTKLYYINPYGVLERTGWFTFSGHEFDAGLGFSGKSGGYGYANTDCSLMTNTYTYDWNNNYVYMEGDGHLAGSQTGTSGDNINSNSGNDNESNSSNNTNTDNDNKVSSEALFEKCSLSTTQIDSFGYWLYTPSDPTNDMPLIVYLHGGSGKGNDLDKLTAIDGFPQYLSQGQFGNLRAYVIIPQLPSNIRGWKEAGDSLMALINEVTSNYSIDKANISLTGHSMGGTGTWDIGIAYNNIFVRIAPLSGSVKELQSNINALKNTPVRAFVGEADTIVAPTSSIQFVSSLKTAGADADITILPDAGHFDVPSLVYSYDNQGLIEWLIGENK